MKFDKIEELGKFSRPITFYSDGSSRPNHSGWAWYSPELNIFNRKVLKDKTNNFCELSAFIDCLTFIIKSEKIHKNKIFVYCDSEYVLNTYTSWIDMWKKNGWKKKDGREILNLDLIKIIYELKKNISSKKMDIQFIHVNSHQSDKSIINYCNNLVDYLANMD